MNKTNIRSSILLMLSNFLEGIYIVYMYIFFKTSFCIHHSYEKLFTNYNNLLKHPINKFEYSNKIYTLGKIVSIIFLFWFIFRTIHWKKLH